MDYRPTECVVNNGTCEECYREGVRVQTCIPGDLNSMYLCDTCRATVPTTDSE